MKILPSITLSLMFLGFWSCSDSGEPKLEGCTDLGACNYSSENTHNDGSCAYPDTNYDCCPDGQVSDCTGECGGTAVLDCNGDCGGSIVEDCAGTCGGTVVKDNCEECGGDNSTCNISYSLTIQPIFTNNCGNCHLGNSSGGLNLSSYTNVMNGVNDGAVITPYDHTTSELYIRITLPSSSDENMPPQGSLSQDDIDLIAQWIDEGALGN